LPNVFQNDSTSTREATPPEEPEPEPFLEEPEPCQTGPELGWANLLRVGNWACRDIRFGTWKAAELIICHLWMTLYAICHRNVIEDFFFLTLSDPVKLVF
jgi:hypothetical protein